MNKDYVVLVDPNGQPIGEAEKMEAHEKGLLHSAFSVLIINDWGEHLLHQRALSKYHSAGKWTNACCSHPRPNEDIEAAAHRRLNEELGVEGLTISRKFSFVYRFKDEPSQLTEHEYDTVFLANFNGPFQLNSQEIAKIRWVSPADLTEEMETKPDQFSFWFRIIFEEIKMRNLL